MNNKTSYYSLYLVLLLVLSTTFSSAAQKRGKRTVHIPPKVAVDTLDQDRNSLVLQMTNGATVYAPPRTFKFVDAAAAQVDTIEVHSFKMNIEVKNIIILPEGYDTRSEVMYPVVYLLHGYSGNYSTWLKSVKPTLPQLASKWQIIIVCPDGKNSWYWDSPINPKSQYDTYVSKELVGYVDSHYKTIKSPKGRAISGLSMGGHGAMWLTTQHPDVFGACGSMSGGVDIRPFPQNWDMAKSLGSYTDNKALWDARTVTTNIDKLAENNIPFIFDCGQDDFFLDVNENLHKLLLSKKIQHTYIMTSGEHNSQYWSKAVEWQLQFFGNFFYVDKK